MRAFVVGNYMNANFLFVPRLPRPGESLAARGHFQEHGGKGLNLAVGLHRLGARTDALIAVGDDAPGRDLTALLAGFGMDVSRIHVVPAASGFGVGFIAPEGRNFLSAFMGANLLLSPDHVEAARELVDDYASACGGVPWLVGGAGVAGMAEMIGARGGQVAPSDPEALRSVVRAAVQRAAGPRPADPRSGRRRS